jgi:apolipoprotein D and lipocalin family protein
MDAIRNLPHALAGAVLLLVLPACASHPPQRQVEDLDLQRFMGDWYVQAHIPTRTERNAYNGVESYALDGDGRILTTYVFRKGAFDADLKVMEPTGFVSDESNAKWGMRFIWPFKAEFLVSYLDPDYTETIIARTKRDYVWVMTRAPEISDERMAALTAQVAELGYDVSELRRVPQRWPDPGHPVTQADGPLALHTRASD